MQEKNVNKNHIKNIKQNKNQPMNPTVIQSVNTNPSISVKETPVSIDNVNEKYILDPLSVIIQLSVLSKKKMGTKLCIHQNAVCIQEVGFFQPLVRYLYKHTKNDIQYLYNPIELACSTFLYPDIISAYPTILKLFTSAQKGILSLIETYKHSMILTHTLYMYYNIISNYLGSSFNEHLFMKDELTSLYEPSLVSSLNLIWKKERLKILLDIIDFIENDAYSVSSIKCLDEFMNIIDNEVNHLIVQYIQEKTNKIKIDL